MDQSTSLSPSVSPSVSPSRSGFSLYALIEHLRVARIARQNERNETLDTNSTRRQYALRTEQFQRKLLENLARKFRYFFKFLSLPFGLSWFLFGTT